jgi:flagellar hook protein FlgE
MSMTLSDSINTALSGLDADSARLSSISSNVSNSSTVGYKASETEFENMVLGNGSGSFSAAGVTPVTQMDVSTAGQIQSTGVNTDIAINGEGFMVVNSSATPTTGTGNYYLTQAGSFRPDANGNLVNAAGYYLQGQALDSSGNPVGGMAQQVSSLSTVNVSNLYAAATPTTQMTFGANLPSSETAYNATTPTPSTSSVTYYDSLGNPQTLQFQFTPTQPAAAGDPATNTWTMDIFDSASTTPTTAVGSATLTFASTGATAGDLASVTTTAGSYDPNAGTFNITTGGGTTLPIKIGAIGSSSGLTQLGGSYTPTQMQQNGSSFGTLQDVSIGNNGIVTASFSNGSTRPIYQLDLAMVSNPDGLTPVSGGAFAISPTSGTPQLYQAGTGPVGTTEGGSLEGSNVDLSTELTNLIATQQAYSSSAQVVQAANQMLEVLNHLSQ